MVNKKETGKKSRGEKRGILGYLAGVKEEFLQGLNTHN